LGKIRHPLNQGAPAGIRPAVEAACPAGALQRRAGTGVRREQEEYMKVKGMMRRGTGILMAAALALGPASGGMPGWGAAEGTGYARAAGVEYLVEKPGAKLLPAQAAGNDTFLSAYVRQERKGTYNSNARFQLTDSKNLNQKEAVNKGIDTLNSTARYWHNKNEKWYVDYSWNFGSDSLVKKLWNSGELELNFSGNLYSDHHSNGKNHWSKKWDRVRVRLTGLNAGPENTFFNELSASDKDGQAQAYSKSYVPGVNQNQGIRFWAGSNDCSCGSSGVGGPVIYLTDTKAPQVKQVYAASDAEGKRRLTEDQGLKAGEQAYFVLEFGESIRFADNQAQVLTLGLDCAWRDSDQSVQEKVTAELVSVKGNRMVFRLTVPRMLDGRAADIYVTSVSASQEWAGRGSEFSWVLLNEDGSTFSTEAGMLDKIGSRITDIAGNPVDWSGSVKTLSEKTYLDTVQPELKKITLSGSRINGKSNVTKDENGSWPADIDLSAVYAGPGSRMTFGVWYSEKITGIDLAQVRAKLNLVDGSGSPVMLGAKELLSVTGKSAFGADAGAGYVSELVFEEFQVTEEMEYAEGESGAIRILEIEGMGSAADIAGNRLNASFQGDSQIVETAAQQQQYLDVQAPSASTSLSMQGDCYQPMGQDGFLFTVPVAVEDNQDGSGVVGLDGSFALLGEAAGIPYSWYVDTNPSAGGDAVWKTASVGTDFSSADQNRLPQLGGENGNAAYLHIRLEEGQDYGYTDDGCFAGTLAVGTVDYAGNRGTVSFPLRHRVDAEKPAVQKTGYTASYQNSQVHMEAGISVTDGFGIASVKYYWDEDQGNAVEIPAGEDPRKREFTAQRDIAAASGESGTAALHVLATDIAGNLLEWSDAYSYNTSTAGSIYRVNAGTPDAPVFAPEIYMTHPADLAGVDGSGTVRADSMLLIEIGGGEYYGCLPDYGEESSLIQDGNVLAGLPCQEGSGTESYPYREKWYRLTGTVDADTDTAVFTGHTKVETADLWQIGKFLREQYGELAVYFLSSPELVKTADGEVQNHFSVSSGNRGSIDRESLHIAAKCVYEGGSFAQEGELPAYISMQITDVLDGEGVSVQDRLCSPAAGSAVSSAEGLGFVLELENLADTGEVQYGLSLIDFNQSRYTVRLLQEGGEGRIVHRGTLSPAARQVLTIPREAAKEGGWYEFSFEITQTNGKKLTYDSERYLIDTRQSSVSLLSYEKTYLRFAGDGCAYHHSVTVKSEDYSGAWPDRIKVGLAQVPALWSLSPEDCPEGYQEKDRPRHVIRFGCSYGSAVADFDDKRKVRIYSRSDEDGEENAPWREYAGKDFEVGYTPVLVENFSAEAYGDGLLPLTEGENLVCFQVLDSNGTVVTKEVLLQVSAKGPGVLAWEEEKTPVSSTLTPLLTGQQKLEDLTVKALEPYRGEEETGTGTGEAEEYRFVGKASRVCQFCVYDTYGNLAVSPYEITEVDGLAPEFFEVSTNFLLEQSTIYGKGMYHLSAYVEEEGLSREKLPETILTFDAQDSALLLGKAGAERENNTELVSVRVPVSLEGMDESGDCPVYEQYDVENRGIFMTQVTGYQEAEYVDGYWTAGQYRLEIWGVLPYDDTKEEYAKTSHSFTVTVMDRNGNSDERQTESVTGSNRKAVFSLGNPVVNENTDPVSLYMEPQLDEEGRVGIYSMLPVVSVYSYGAGAAALYDDTMYGYCHHVTLPMLNRDGTYQIEYTDLFGNQVQQELEVGLFGNSELALDVSETEYTNRDVTVTARVVSGEASIVSMSAVDEDGAELASGVLEGENAQSAWLVMPKNGRVTVETHSEAEGTKTYLCNIMNIDKELEPALIFYEYNGMTEPEYLTEGGNTVEGEVTAVLSCEEFAVGVNGPLRYTFGQGSRAGEEYTFVYMDQAGNVGELTARLPVDIAAKEPPVVENDTDAPNYTVECYGMRNDQYTFLGSYVYMVSEEDSAADIAAWQQEAGESVTEIFSSYAAQGYRMLFQVEDESSTRVILKRKGAAPPASYEEAGDEVEGVTVTGSTVTIAENDAAFDLYLADSFGNVTPFQGVEIRKLDNQAPKVTVRYDKIPEEDGTVIVRSTFDVEGDEQIFASDSRLQAFVEDLEETYEDESGNLKKRYRNIIVYYLDHSENGSYEFKYRDIYGNMGTAVAQVGGIDNVKPLVNAVRWYGTRGNKSPEEGGNDGKVNHSAAAELTVSKAVNKVELYRYDEQAEENAGELITGEDAEVSASFVGQKVTVTYEENEQEILVKIYASSNGKTVTQKLPAVSCIDKTPPEAAIERQELSEGKRSMTYYFQMNEPAVFAESRAGNRTQPADSHVWTADKNGEVLLHFTDEAGNVLEYSLTVDGIDDKKLKLSYSLSADGSGAREDAAELNLKAGDTLYVSADKEAELELGGRSVTAQAGEWTEFTLPAEGGFCILKALDSSAKEVQYAALAVNLADKSAPVISFREGTVCLTEDVSAEEMRRILYDGTSVSITDNVDDITEFEVIGIPEKVARGVYTLTYRAQDQSGNVGTAARTLYIAGRNAQQVSLNGQQVQPFSTTILRGEDLQVDAGGAPAVVKIKKGIKTSGQMKYGAVILQKPYVYENPAPGYYTVYVRAQDRQETILYVYVEE